MEVLSHQSVLISTVLPLLEGETFTLIDVGCSGGIDPVWNIFGQRLQAFGFDPNIAECNRLQAAATNPNIRYIPEFVGLPPDHPFKTLRGDRAYTERNPWNRLAVKRTMDIQQERRKTMSNKELTNLNAWPSVELADSDNPVVLPNYLSDQGVCDVDFVKIDIDGADFEVLHSLEHQLEPFGVLGVAIEVNWIGSDHAADHSFHNVDRFLRKAGFDLFDLTFRKYSMAALPGRYLLTIPAQNHTGRPIQGDALYLRDLAAPALSDMAASLSNEKLLKLAVLFELAGQPDSAAELLIVYSGRLNNMADISHMLDVLATSPAAGFSKSKSYKDHMRRFEEDDPAFYP